MIEERHLFYDQGMVGHYEIVLKKSGYSLNALRMSIQQDSFYGSDARCMGQADRLSFSSKVDIVLASLGECRSNDDATTLFGIALSLVTGYLFANLEANGAGASSEGRGLPMAIMACAGLLAVFVWRRISMSRIRNRLAQSLYILKHEAERSADKHSQ